MGPLRSTTYYLPPNLSSPAATLLVGGGLGLVGLLLPLAYVLRSWARHRRREQQEKRALDAAGKTLRAGDTVVHGRVDDDSQGPAITVAITQDLVTGQRGGSSWVERSRQVTVRPFYVVRGNGERVRVEPDGNVFLVDKLDGLEASGRAQRRRLATLTAGESVYVIGRAMRGLDPGQGGYRDGAVGLVMRPPAVGRMLVSTEPLGLHHRRLAAVDARAALVLAVGLVVTHLLLFGGVWRLLLGGRVEMAFVERAYTTQSWVTPRRGPSYWATHSFIDVKTPAWTRTFRTSSEFGSDVASGRAVDVPLLTDGTHAQLGTAPVANDALVILYALFFPLFIAGTLGWRSTRQPWYERARVVDVGENGRVDSQTT